MLSVHSARSYMLEVFWDPGLGLEVIKVIRLG